MRETRQDKTLGQVRKWINTNPGLKVDNRFNIFCINLFNWFIFRGSLDQSNSKLGGRKYELIIIVL